MRVELTRLDMPKGKQKMPASDISWKSFYSSLMKAIWPWSEEIVFIDEDGTRMLIKDKR